MGGIYVKDGIVKILYYYGDKPSVKGDRIKEMYTRGNWVGTTLLAHEEVGEDALYLNTNLFVDSLIIRGRRYKIICRELELESPRILWIKLEEVISEMPNKIQDNDTFNHYRAFGEDGNENGELDEMQTRFVNEFIKDYDSTQAALRAGYPKQTSSANSSVLLSKRKIIKAIEKAKFDELKIK